MRVIQVAFGNRFLSSLTGYFSLKVRQLRSIFDVELVYENVRPGVAINGVILDFVHFGLITPCGKSV